VSRNPAVSYAPLGILQDGPIPDDW